MKTLQERIVILSVLLCLICAIQVSALPLPEEWDGGLLTRTKRSLLWRWNSMKPIGASCREHSECGTKYCRRNTCAFWISY
ncbi:liver-expressed antimicrobial peptide 2-like [Solea solea]|uniref:liver-expressed antimicrobial peptide 2-like n=1 Tax=Solea solea TaxID=90069 RepID=UPI002729F905|nr:liver-expressed antimicrobial peptide 2-like [Solea solea]